MTSRLIYPTDAAYKAGRKKRRKGPPKREVHGKIELPGDGSSSGDDNENAAITMELTDRTAKPPKKFLLPIMYKQINYPHMLRGPRKMLQMYLQKTDPAGEKGDESQNVTLEKTKPVVDEKGDNIITKQEDLPTIHEQEVTESTSAQGTVDTKPDTKEEAQNTGARTHKDEDEEEIGLDYLKVFGTIKEVNEFLDMESKYFFIIRKKWHCCFICTTKVKFKW